MTVLIVVLALVLAPALSAKNDNFDVEIVLGNPRVLNAYLKCFLNTGPCTKEGREMRRLLPEVLKTACKSCNPETKYNFRQFLRRVQVDPKLSDAWVKVMTKYDPKRQYQAGLAKFLNEG